MKEGDVATVRVAPRSFGEWTLGDGNKIARAAHDAQSPIFLIDVLAVIGHAEEGECSRGKQQDKCEGKEEAGVL